MAHNSHNNTKFYISLTETGVFWAIILFLIWNPVFGVMPGFSCKELGIMYPRFDPLLGKAQYFGLATRHGS
jgi:hypothetical protein